MSGGEDLRGLLEQRGLTTVAGVFALEGGQDLSKAGLGHRRRTRVVLPDHGGVAFYVKRYGREPLLVALRRWFTYGLRGSPASVEAANIEAARSAGLTQMEVLASGQEGPPHRPVRSFLVVREIDGQSLERCGPQLARRLGEAGVSELLTERLAELVARLHGAGYVHRDLYACHIFVERGLEGGTLSLIDLARMFRPRWRAFRWQVKDLAQLRSSMDVAWVQQCWEPFLRGYLRTRGEGAFGRYNRAVVAKCRRIAAGRLRKGSA